MVVILGGFVEAIYLAWLHTISAAAANKESVRQTSARSGGLPSAVLTAYEVFHLQLFMAVIVAWQIVTQVLHANYSST